MAGFARFLMTIAASLVCSIGLGGCGGDDGGPADTTISLTVDPVTSPTNQATQRITGMTDADATVTIKGPADSVSGPAASGGAFSLTLGLASNANNAVEVSARDQAGNQRSETVSILHDDIAPNPSFTEPSAGSTTPGQSGFTIRVNLSEESSGIDQTSFEVMSNVEIGGVFTQEGTFTTVISGGTDLSPLFTVSSSSASWAVPDTLIFAAGPVQLTTRVNDLAGNASSATRDFQVGPDPNKLVVVNTSASAGATEVPVIVGLANPIEAAGVQFDFMFDTLVVASLDSVTVRDRASTFDSTPSNEVSRGQVRVILFDGGGDRISAGQGAILTLWLTLDASAASGGHTLTLDSIVVSEGSGSTSPAAATTGNLTVQ